MPRHQSIIDELRKRGLSDEDLRELTETVFTELKTTTLHEIVNKLSVFRNIAEMSDDARLVLTELIIELRKIIG